MSQGVELLGATFHATDGAQSEMPRVKQAVGLVSLGASIQLLLGFNYAAFANLANLVNLPSCYSALMLLSATSLAYLLFSSAKNALNSSWVLAMASTPNPAKRSFRS